MIAKLIALLTSRESAEQLTAQLRDNPKTSIVGIACLALFGTSATLYTSGYLIAGGLLGGIAALIACIALLFAGDGGTKQ